MVQRATTVVELRHDISIWHRMRLNGSPTRLCTSLAEDKNLPCSDKALANTKEEQLGNLPKLMYKFLHTDSSDDDSDSDCSELYEAEVKAIAMAEEEAQIQKEILANYKEGELYCYNPNIKYEPLKRYDVPRFVFSEDSSSDLSDLESNAQNETMAEEEAQTQKDKILAGTKDELLSHYDIDKSLTSTDFQSVAENLAVSPSTDPQSTAAVPSLSASDKLGAKGPAEGGIKDLKQAKERDICTGLGKVANDDQNKCGEV